jgi:hypothetical protein
VNSSPYARKETFQGTKAKAVVPYDNGQDDRFQESYPMNVGSDSRPTNRLGCSRAFHQTKENWGAAKDNGHGGVHSLPRNAHYPGTVVGSDGGIDHSSGQYSCKATSSATSLTLSKQQQ